MNKEQLINELLHFPLSFTSQMLESLLSLGFTFTDFRECIRRIYDLSESQLTQTSNANTGMIGRLNRRSTSKRLKQFNKRIGNLKEGDKYKIIYAEGDSWFQFPVFVKDVIDWLNKKEEYIIYSDAYGGDWITNIIYESQYVSALSVLRPTFFLISGGGNDMVGNNRLAMMVSRNYNQPKYTSPSAIHDPSLSPHHTEMIMKAQDHITKEFYAFLWIIKAMYLLLLRQIYAGDSTQNNLITITQGYDYAIPGIRPGWTLRYPMQPLVNKVLDNGCWLSRPLKIRGIFEEELQKALVMTFIYEFNQVFISLANDPGLGKVFHVDSRGLASDSRSWYDELHYKSHVFKKVARAYEYIMENHSTCNKVIRVVDII